MALLAIFLIVPGSLARADDFCQARDDKAEIEGVDKFFETTLRDHGTRAYARNLKAQVKTKAKGLLVEKFQDTKKQLCADHLQLAADIKSEPAHWSGADCASFAVVGLVDTYMRKVATTYDANQKELTTQQNAHLQELKRLLFEIAKGSSAGLEGISFQGYAIASAPKNVKFEWIKQEATKLAAEAHRAWGGVEPGKNPLVQQNLVIGREAIRARAQRESLRRQLGSPERQPASCVRKP
jgi:hypothetical protein